MRRWGKIMSDLRDKTAVVTAASRGIGRAVAERLARHGARVVISYVDSDDKAEEVVQSIEGAGSHGLAVKSDVSQRAEVEALFDRAETAFGPVDIVVNCAGASVFKPLQAVTDEDFEKSVAINVRGALNVLQRAAMRVRDGGRIVHISTGGTAMPVPGGGLYAGTKAAGEMMALCLAKELGQRKVTVNVVSPGVTKTDGLIMPQEQLDSLVAQTPLGRLGEPGDVADVIVFLCTDEARWMTGQNVRPNGGIL